MFSLTSKNHSTFAGAAWLSVWLSSSFICIGCADEPPLQSQGAEFPEMFGRNGQSCGHGLAVIMTDYASTNVALLDFAGETHSASLISSGSSEARLNAPLSGDVVFPSSRMNEITLIDRYPASVVSFVKPQNAEVRGQMQLRTGFNANPQDFLQLSEDVALVSRYEKNPRAGREPFDAGDDLLIVNPQSMQITGRVDLSELGRDDELVRPGSLSLLDEFVLVTLSGFDAHFADAGNARVAILAADTFELVDVWEILGLKNCGTIAISPNAQRLALSCSGLFDSASESRPEFSGVVIFSRDENDSALDFEIEQRFLASDSGLGPFSSSLAFATSELILASTYGALDGADAGRPDRVVSIGLTDSKIDTRLSSQEDAFNLGDIRCIAPCEVCFVADASRGVVHRMPVVDGALAASSEHLIDVNLSLPPRQLGWF